MGFLQRIILVIFVKNSLTISNNVITYCCFVTLISEQFANIMDRIYRERVVTIIF